MMILITSDEQIRQNIPNVLATVEGEPTLIEKLSPFIEQAEEWLAENFTSTEILQAIATVQDSTLKRLCVRVVIIEAFRAAVPSLDLVLTPNGFGIVSNQNIAPASKERVERLVSSLEEIRDSVVENLLLHLSSMSEWQQTAQGNYFASTMFPFLNLCRRLAIREHIWDEYQHLHHRLIKIENVLADTYFSQEQMTVFRQHVMNQMRECSPLEEHVIRSLQSLEMMLVSDMQVHPQSFYDLVNIIREHEETFPAWHSSDTAKLYSPAVFVNKKKAGGYWF